MLTIETANQNDLAAEYRRLDQREEEIKRTLSRAAMKTFDWAELEKVREAKFAIARRVFNATGIE